MNIFVGNLPLQITEDELGQEFMGFGEVISVDVRSDERPGSGHPWAYGFVCMASKSEGDAAIAGLQGRSLGGQIIELIAALPVSVNRTKGSSNNGMASRFDGGHGQERRRLT